MIAVSRRSFAIGTCALLLPIPASAQTGLEKTTVSYRSIDGHAILVDIYRPKGNEPCPVIVWFHAGALIMGSREWLIPQIRELATQKNFAVVSFDYRLAPETKLSAIVSDMETAFDWLGRDGARRFHLDAHNMVVAGNSAGAYLALVAGYRANPKPKAVVSLYGYGRLSADWYVKPNPYPEYNSRRIAPEDIVRLTSRAAISEDPKGARETIYLYYRQTGLWPREVSGFSPGMMAQELAPYEPAKNVTRDYPPTLLIHGIDDHDVPYEEALNMAAQLKQHDVPYVLKSVDKAGHLLAGGDKAQIEDSYQTMRDFIAKYLGSG
jgi:acetyl esterase/lipase